MPRRKQKNVSRAKVDPKRPIETYEHKGKERLNNPPVGLVTPETDPDAGQKKKTYAYDPHLDPQLQWAGKTEHASFDVPTVSLHVHEQIEPCTIIEAVRKKNGNGQPVQGSLFEEERTEPLRHAVEFYQHRHGWSNRLIAGDSLLVMNSLLEKEGMAGKVQMVYIDPPYGIRYGSNFQPFVNKRDVKDGSDEDLTAEPEQIRAFRDTWELGIHSYLTYLRDRLLLARELLHESGSCFVQISDENLHLLRNLMDDVFGAGNFVVVFPVKKKGNQKSRLIDPVNDYVIWYAKSPRETGKIKFRKLYRQRELDDETLTRFNRVVLPDGREFDLDSVPSPTDEEHLIDYRRTPRQLLRDWPGVRLAYCGEQFTSGGTRPNQSDPIEVRGITYRLKPNLCWKTTTRTEDGSPAGVDRLRWADRLVGGRDHLNYKRFLDDFGYTPMSNWWDALGGAPDPVYVVQTNPEIIARCLLMTTDPGDLVFDPTCGSGTTAYVAEQWGRRWITCDTSRVALTLAKQRLMTAVFDYYELAHPDEGVNSGFKYKTVPHVTLKSIANNPEIDGIHARWQTRLEPIRQQLNALLKQSWEEWQIPREADAVWPEKAKALLDEWWQLRRKRQEEIDAAIARHAPQETLYDQPLVDRKKVRVTGPFTVEAVPAPAVKSVEELLEGAPQVADASIARSGETLRQGEWRDELLRAGIRGKSGQHIRFARLEPLPGCRWLHADGETKDDKPQRIVVSFGPEHAPLEQRQVAQAIEEAPTLVPRPRLIVFAAFQFDPEAARDIDETNWPGVTLLKAQMNADLLTEDLKKKRASNESFWLIGQPDVHIEKVAKGEDKGKFTVSVHGFDYYNTKTGDIESGGEDKIAVWLLDTDYDGRCLYPRQVFFPIAGKKDGWARLATNLKAEIDKERIEAYRGTVSLPFEAGAYKRIAVKIVDDRGIESLKVMELT